MSAIEELLRRQQSKPQPATSQGIPEEVPPAEIVMENPYKKGEMTPEILQATLALTAGLQPVGHETLSGREGSAAFYNAGKSIQLMDIQLANQAVKLASGGAANRLPQAAFLRPFFVEGTMIRKLAPLLPWLEFANRQTTPASEIIWFRQLHAPQNDTLLKEPNEVDEGGDLPLVEMSNPIKKTASTGKYGLATVFTDRALRNTSGVALGEVGRKLDDLKWKLSKLFNDQYVGELANRFDLTYRGTLAADDQVNVLTVTNTWDDPSVNPFEDVRNFALTMEETDEYFFEPNLLMVGPKNWKDLVSYATQVDHNWVKDPTTGIPQLRIDNIIVRKVPTNSGMPDANAILLAQGPGIAPPLDVWDEVNPNLTRSGLLHVQSVFDEKSLNTWFGFHRTFAVANRNPKAVGVFFGTR